MSFKFFGIQYIEEGFHLYDTHIILLNKNYPVYDTMGYKACCMQCGGFAIWYLISLMNFNMRDLLRGWNRSFVCFRQWSKYLDLD